MLFVLNIQAKGENGFPNIWQKSYTYMCSIFVQCHIFSARNDENEKASDLSGHNENQWKYSK